MIVLGIDPGTATTGYGVIKSLNSKTQNLKDLECLSYGLIQTNPRLPAGERLKKINNELNRLIKKYQPTFLAVESIYFFKNLKTAMPVSQAKGIILFTAAKRKIPVYEFTPLEIKMTISGYGRATKEQIQRMIKLLLDLKEIPRPDDAADALGAAICCSLLQRKTPLTEHLRKL